MELIEAQKYYRKQCMVWIVGKISREGGEQTATSSLSDLGFLVCLLVKPTSLNWVLKTVAVAHLCCFYVSGEKRGRLLDFGSDIKCNEEWVITSMKTEVLQLSCWLAGWCGANLCEKCVENGTIDYVPPLQIVSETKCIFCNTSGLFFLNHLMLRCIRSSGLNGFSFKMSVSVWRFCNHPFCTIFFLNDRSQKKLSRLHVTYEGTIESNGQGMLQVSTWK